MPQNTFKHLFEHLKWSRNDFGKIILDPFWTPITLPQHVHCVRCTALHCSTTPMGD